MYQKPPEPKYITRVAMQAFVYKENGEDVFHRLLQHQFDIFLAAVKIVETVTIAAPEIRYLKIFCTSELILVFNFWFLFPFVRFLHVGLICYVQHRS